MHMGRALATYEKDNLDDAERCFEGVRSHGYRDAARGSACIAALSIIGHCSGVQEIRREREKER
jgi:hypothetical protein